MRSNILSILTYSINKWKFLKFFIDMFFYACYISINWTTQTVDAEITAVMPLQRIRDAEIRVRNRLSNGPQRAQSNVLIQSILRRQAYVNCRRYVGISLSARVASWIKVAPRIDYSSLTESIDFVRDFFYAHARIREIIILLFVTTP